MPAKPTRMTVPRLTAMKRGPRKITMLTAYDFALARILDEAGVDALLVGDSLSMVVQGHETTLQVTLDQMIYHAEMVCRAVSRAVVIVDMPFPTYHLGAAAAVANAARIIQESRCQAVKLEGGVDQADTIRALVRAGIPVMAHVGLRPQAVLQMGGYRVQRDGQQLRADARAAEEAGAFAMVLECIPADIAATISGERAIPTIGIGAGAGCDGQVLVTYDLLGLTSGYVPSFVRQFADLRSATQQAVKAYCEQVVAGTFPGPDESF